MFTAKEKQGEALREIGQRRRVYANLIAQGRLKGSEADRRIAIMTEIADEYGQQARADEAKERFL